MKILNNELFDEVLEAAIVSSRRRMNYDLRTQVSDRDPLWHDSSQRMLNVMMQGRMVQSSLKPKTGRMTRLRQRSSCKFRQGRFYNLDKN